MHCLFTELASDISDSILLSFVFHLYFDISFGKIIREMSSAAFDVALHCLLRKRARIQRFTEQITTIEKKKRANRLTKRLYRLALDDERTLIHVETVYAAKLRNRTIPDPESEDESQDLRTIATATPATRLEIALKVFQR